MSRDIDLTTQGDIKIENGDLVISEETQTIANNVRIRLLTILAEWFYDYTVGLDWFDELFATSTTYDQKVSILKNEILKDPEITSITSFQFAIDPVARSGEVEFTADTIFSPINVEVTI
jgi:hypothetical protein